MEEEERQTLPSEVSMSLTRHSRMEARKQNDARCGLWEEHGCVQLERSVLGLNERAGLIRGPSRCSRQALTVVEVEGLFCHWGLRLIRSHQGPWTAKPDRICYFLFGTPLRVASPPPLTLFEIHRSKAGCICTLHRRILPDILSRIRQVNC